ncbi:MAG TPA: BMP family ABC transporter substrate-binding protein [Candidatus Dormibacteraeota bacterium]|nr:BMP family ABC transporter substrate-binding protein [Candidatus Dormibacteraeota bacterium]
MQAGASGTRPKPATAATTATTATSSCVKKFSIGFVADVAGLNSRADAAAWQGVGEALRHRPCAHAYLAIPTRPSQYGQVLQAYAGYDIVIAGSFLLTSAVVDAARANPDTHFLLVDPIVAPAGPANLAVLTFRDDQAAYLAGALAGMVTKTGVIAGVYGPGGAPDQRDRTGFEHGALYVRPGVRVLGAYQPAADGRPYDNPAWGAAQARAFVQLGADVIFGTGGTTGQGALLGAAQAGSLCIGAEVDSSLDPAARSCLLASSMKFIDRGVALTVADAAAGHWAGGVHAVGLAEGAVELGSLRRELLPGQLERLQTIAGLLAAGS